MYRVLDEAGISPTLTRNGANHKIIVDGHISSLRQRGNVYNDEGIMGCLTATDYKTPKIIIEGKIDGVAYDKTARVIGTEGIYPTVCASLASLKIQEKSYRLRKLTPLECMRLQGFPDHYYHTLKDNGISNTQIYKMAGNAVSPPVISSLIKELIK